MTSPIRKFIFPKIQCSQKVGYEQYKEDPVKYSNYFPLVIIYDDNAIFECYPNFGEPASRRYCRPTEFFSSDYYLYPRVNPSDVKKLNNYFGFECKQGWDAPTCKRKFLDYIFEKYPEPCDSQIKRSLCSFVVNGHENGYIIPNPNTGDFIEIF